VEFSLKKQREEVVSWRVGQRYVNGVVVDNLWISGGGIVEKSKVMYNSVVELRKTGGSYPQVIHKLSTG
jgi:hypothetical protein